MRSEHSQLGKWLLYRLAQFKPLLAKRFETTKTLTGHKAPLFVAMHANPKSGASSPTQSKR